MKYRDVVILNNVKDPAEYVAKSQCEILRFTQYDMRRSGKLLYYLLNKNTGQGILAPYSFIMCDLLLLDQAENLYTAKSIGNIQDIA